MAIPATDRSPRTSSNFRERDRLMQRYRDEQVYRDTSEDKSRFAVTIARSPVEVFAFWRNFNNLSFFMKDVAEVVMLTPNKSHWVIKLESGATTEWDAEISSERPGEMISWKSIEGSPVDTDGTVWFSRAPGNLGTIVRLSMNYSIPGGMLTELVTKITQEDPATLTMTNLRRLKAYLETGEIPTIEGQPSGRDEHSRVLNTH